MTADQNSFFQMLYAVCATVDRFADAWSHHAPFATPYRRLKAEVAGKEVAALAKQAQKSTGATKDKDAAREALEARIGTLAGALEAYALTAGNRLLRDDVHIAASDIQRLSAKSLLGLAGIIGNRAGTHLAALAPYGIRAAALKQLDAAAAAFTACIRTPQAILSEKRDGTRELETLKEKAVALLEVLDVQAALFRERAPDFFTQYTEARKRVSPPKHPRAITVVATDAAGRPLEGVTVELPGLKLTKRTGVSGACHVKNAQPGIYVGKAWKHGYAGQELSIPVNTGETAQVRIVLTPAP